MTLFKDLRLLLILFISLRVMLLMAFQPLGDQSGMTLNGDYFAFFRLAGLTNTLGAPFEAWWSEYPPIWTWLYVGVYRLTGENFSAFVWGMYLLLLAADTGALILVRAIGIRLHGEDMGVAIGWIYALLGMPLIISWWTFEALVVVWLLLGLWWLINGRDLPSALAVSIGALTKLTPALLFGAVLRYRSRIAAARYIGIAVGLFALVYVPLLLGNPAMTLPSLTAQFGKASNQTVWALLDGNYGTSHFGRLEERADPPNAARLNGNPSIIPAWVRLGVAGMIGLIVFITTRRSDAEGIVSFTAITLLIFFLQAQAWSPQWLAQILPLLLLCFPNRVGVLLLLALCMASLAEYPTLFVRTSDGILSGTLVPPFILLVVFRTLLLSTFCVMLYRQLR